MYVGSIRLVRKIRTGIFLAKEPTILIIANDAQIFQFS
jgi:hypothetical protein